MRSNRASGLPVIFVINFSEGKATNKVAAGDVCPTAGCSRARHCREINDCPGSCLCHATPLVGRGRNVQGGGRLMIIRLQKSLLGEPSDGSNCGFCWEAEIPCVQKTNWKGKEIQTKVINAEQALWQGVNRFPFDKQQNWWLSSSFIERKKRCQNLLLEKSPTQSDYQNTAGNPREEAPWTTGKNNTRKYSISFDLRRTKSVIRKLWLQL